MKLGIQLLVAILFEIIFFNHINAQQIQFAKRVSGTDISCFALGNNYVLLNNFNDSCQFDTMPIGYKALEELSINCQVTVLSKQGDVLSHFTLTGVTQFNNGLNLSQQLLNDSEWVMATSMVTPIYTNGILQVDSVNSTNELMALSNRLVAVSVSGRVRLLMDFPLYSTGAISTVSIHQAFKNNKAFSFRVDTSGQRLFTLFNCAYPTDSQLINPQYFEKDKAILFEVDLATRTITNNWKLPVEFDRMAFVGGKLILGGRSLRLNHQFTVQNQTYTRDSINDEATSDLVWGAFNPNTGVFDWHQHYKLKMKDKSSSGYFTLANTNNRVALVCWYNDTIRVNGTLYGEAIPFLTKSYFAMIGADINGEQIWVNTFSEILNLTQFYSKGSNFCLGFYGLEGGGYMNEQLLSKTRKGENYLQIVGQTGALRRSFNYVFKPNWENKFDGIDVTEDSIQFAIVSLFGLPSDTITLLDKRYYLKDPMAAWSEYVLVAYKATPQSFPTNTLERPYIEHRPVQVYPNPANGMVYLRGFAEEQESLVKVVTMQGKVVLEREQPFGLGIDAGSWDKGIYFIHVQTGPNIQVCKLIKE